MFNLRLLVGLLELSLMIVMSAFIIYVTYRIFIKANPDFDMEAEIKNGNAAVGALMAGILFASAMVLKAGMGASIGMMRLNIYVPAEATLPAWKIALLALGHLVLSISIAVAAVSVTLRLFGRMWHRLNPDKKLGAHLKDGNIAAGILLAAVVLITSLYIGEGVSALTKALVPQPSIGKIQIMR